MAFCQFILFSFLSSFSSSRRTLVRLRGEKNDFPSKSPRSYRALCARPATVFARAIFGGAFWHKRKRKRDYMCFAYSPFFTSSCLPLFCRGGVTPPACKVDEDARTERMSLPCVKGGVGKADGGIVPCRSIILQYVLFISRDRQSVLAFLRYGRDTIPHLLRRSPLCTRGPTVAIAVRGCGRGDPSPTRKNAPPARFFSLLSCAVV